MDLTYSPGLRDLIARITPTTFKFDPFGLVSGYKAYRIWAHLDGLHDRELDALGVDRMDIPRLTAQTILAD